MSTALSTALSTVPGGVPLSAVSTVPGGVPLSYFHRFVTNGFQPDLNCSFEDEFARLARHMRWLSGPPAYCRQLRAARRELGGGTQLSQGTERYEGTMEPRNHLAAHTQRLMGRRFQPDPSLPFNEEFARLGQAMGWKTGSRAYLKQRDKAMLHEVEARKCGISSILVLKTYIDNNGFQPNAQLSFSSDFKRLAAHMNWNPSSRLFTDKRRQALNEAVQTPPAQNQIVLVHRGRPLPAPSTAQGVPLPRQHAPPPSIAPSSSYFSGFAAQGFTIDPNVPFQDEFARLALHMGWQSGTQTRVEQWRNALESEMGDQYGDSSKLSGWQALCVEVGIENPPESITKCKKVR